MLIEDEDTRLLKEWIVKRLSVENTSDADADVLADYALALLKHDATDEVVREMCEREMVDFLKDETKGFVAEVFDAIKYKLYVPGAVAPAKATATATTVPFAPPAGPSMPSYGGLGNGVLAMGQNGLGQGQNGSRKRSYQDRGDVEMGGSGFGGEQNGRSYKQPRRGGPGRGGFDGGRGGYDQNGRGGFEQNGRGGLGGNRPPMMPNMPPQGGFPAMPGMPSPPAGMPPFDPANPLATLLAMQALGLPLPPMPGMPQAGTPTARPTSTKARCRDYDQKGFCAMGNTCPFEHGEHSIWVPPTNNVNEEYDPTTSLMSTLEGNNGHGRYNQFRGGDRGRGRGQRGDFRGDFRNQSGGPRRPNRSEFSSSAPNYDKNNTSIVVENIPEEKFSEDEVRAFFSTFGTIVNVDMRPYKRLAIVKFEGWAAAKEAYNSPRVIFDNRFVKVYWFLAEDSLPRPPPGMGANGEPKAVTGNPNHAPVKQEPEIDLEEFARKQAEAQKTHEEKLKKKAEMETAKKELEKRQEELLRNQAEEKRKLLERIAAKSGKSAASPDGVAAPATGKSTSATEGLKAQLAALEAEAMSLGIDPAINTSEPLFGYRGRGRGRGVYRGRGTFAPRARGGYRGRGAAPLGASGRSYNLDNRPKKVGLTGVDFTDPKKDESLREFLFGIGEYTDIEVTPARTSVTFKDRFTAEKFFYTPNGEIPAVGKVEMAWIQTPLAPINLTPKPAAASVKVEEDATMDEGDAMASSPAVAGGDAADEPSHNNNYDYDIAGEDEWN